MTNVVEPADLIYGITGGASLALGLAFLKSYTNPDTSYKMVDVILGITFFILGSVLATLSVTTTNTVGLISMTVLVTAIILIIIANFLRHKSKKQNQTLPQATVVALTLVSGALLFSLGITISFDEDNQFIKQKSNWGLPAGMALLLSSVLAVTSENNSAYSSTLFSLGWSFIGVAGGLQVVR